MPSLTSFSRAAKREDLNTSSGGEKGLKGEEKEGASREKYRRGCQEERSASLFDVSSAGDIGSKRSTSKLGTKGGKEVIHIKTLGERSL